MREKGSVPLAPLGYRLIRIVVVTSWNSMVRARVPEKVVLVLHAHVPARPTIPCDWTLLPARPGHETSWLLHARLTKR